MVLLNLILFKAADSSRQIYEVAMQLLQVILSDLYKSFTLTAAYHSAFGLIFIVCPCQMSRSWNPSSSVTLTNWRSCEQMVFWPLPHRCHTSTLCRTTSCLRNLQGLTQNSLYPSSQVCKMIICYSYRSGSRLLWYHVGLKVSASLCMWAKHFLKVKLSYQHS